MIFITIFGFLMAYITMSNYNLNICNGKYLTIWLIVYTSFYLVKIIFNIINIFLDYFSNFFVIWTFIITFPFEIAWVIYGSALVYPFDEDKKCDVG